ncbi:thioredoxin family protein [bacterium]|nr:thioredoxin family protein [bacterium]
MYKKPILLIAVIVLLLTVSTSYAETIDPGVKISTLFQTKGSILGFLGIFLIGLALNLTPCVYPMLSVTVSIFGAQDHRRTLHVFLKALLYVLGIATMYSALGVFAAMSGGLFGAWLQNRWVLVAIAVLLFALALSMFGFYELRMPSWIVDKLGKATRSSAAATLGIYVSGLAVGVFAAPCIGPPIIALLTYVGTKKDLWFGFWSFFVLSLGLGTPYLLFGTFSGLLTKLPKSGLWMVWVKKVFAVILLAVGFFYLMLAVIPRFAVYVVPIFLFSGGIYLGFLEKSGKTKKVFRKIQWAAGSIAVVLSIVSFSFLQKQQMQWEPYSTKTLQSALEAGQPVMIDFYADWCVPCHEMERRTFSDSRVISLSESFKKLRVDLTQIDSNESMFLRFEYGVMGVPTLIFLRPDGNEMLDSRVEGFLPPEKFLQQLKATLAAIESENTENG